MNLSNCTATIDGIEVKVTDVTINYNGADLAEVSIEGIATNFKEKKAKEDMTDTKCADKEYNDLSTVSEFRQLSLTEEDKLLKRNRILNEYGGLSYDGRDFLLEVLFAENKDKVVEALKKIEQARKEK